MYHIKNDRRAKSSAELICRGLLDCLREKSYADVTVSDIQRFSTVSRSTFYRNFDRLDDVLALLCDRGFQEAFSGHGAQALPQAIFHYWYGHGELLEAVVRAGKTDIFLNSFRRCLEDTRAAELMDADSAEFEYFLSSLSYAMIGILAAWIRRDRKESEQQLTSALKSAFSAIEALDVMMLRA